MRHHLLTVARSTYKALHVICPFPRQPCKPCTLWAFLVPSPRAQSLPARGGVKLLDLKRRQQPTFGGVRMSSLDTFPQTQTPDRFQFGPHWISPGEVFLSTKLSFAFVNLRPVVPETPSTTAAQDCDTLDKSKHVLVVPKRLVARFVDLSAEEVTDLWLTAQRVGEKMESFWEASSLTLAIQDGPEAGQSVPHVHVHILPRKKLDFKNNDEIYDEIDKKEKELGDNLNLDQERTDRTPEVMHEEAAKLRALF